MVAPPPTTPDPARVAARRQGHARSMTTPDQNQPPDDSSDATGETGALAAASRDDGATRDPLGPLDRVTEDDRD